MTYSYWYSKIWSSLIEANPDRLGIFMIEVEKRLFSRRDFLKASGAVAAGLLVDKIFPGRALAQTSSEPISQEEEVPVQVREPIFWGNRNRPEIALTFDDGYSQAAIESSLAILRKMEARTTFFVIGQQLRAYPDLWQQALLDGHEICNHTYTHSYLTSLSSEQIKNELSLWEESAQEVLGEEYLAKMKQDFPYIRFPGGAGHKDERVLRVVSQNGYQPIAWSADTYYAVLKNHDYRNEPVDPIAQEVADHIINTSQNGSIPLLHFNVWDITRLEGMIAGVENKDLKITTVSEVLRKESKPEEKPKTEGNLGQQTTRGGLGASGLEGRETLLL